MKITVFLLNPTITADSRGIYNLQEAGKALQQIEKFLKKSDSVLKTFEAELDVIQKVGAADEKTRQFTIDVNLQRKQPILQPSKPITDVDRKKITQSWDTYNELSEKQDYLKRMRVKISIEYKGSPAKGIVDNIDKLLTEVNAQLDRVNQIMLKMSSKYIPSSVMAVWKGVSTALNSVGPHTVKDYIYPDEESIGMIAYARTFIFSNLKTTAGHVYDNYMLVSTAFLQEDGAIVYYATALPEAAIPGDFSPGIEVGRGTIVEKKIANILNVMSEELQSDNIMTSLLRRVLPNKPSADVLKKFSSSILDAEVGNDTLVLKVNPKIGKDEILKGIRLIWNKLEVALGFTDKTNYVATFEKGPKTHNIITITIPPQTSKRRTSKNISRTDLDMVKDILQLNDSEFKALRRTLSR